MGVEGAASRRSLIFTMPIIARRTALHREVRRPDMEAMLDSALIKRCGVCWRQWEAGPFIVEDGIEKCPTCVDTRTEEDKANDLQRITQIAAAHEPEPQMSRAPLRSTFPGSIRNLTGADGNRVYEGSPLRLTRTVAKTLLLLGRDFSASDTITGSTGLTIDVDARTATQTDLSVTADSAMDSGNYSLTFNDVVFYNIFSV